MVQQGGNMKELTGKKIKGFEFKSKSASLPIYNKEMDNYIGKIGVIYSVCNGFIDVQFDNRPWSYPLPEALNHIVEEHPQRGDEVLVWDRYESKAVKRIFLAYIEGAEYPIQVVLNGYEKLFKNEKPFATTKYQNYKTIPQKTKLTMQQIADKFGIDVNYLEIENYER
jgi:hypothetical protein